MTSRRLALILVIFGCALIVIGLAALSPAVAVIFAGACLTIVGLLAIEVRS